MSTNISGISIFNTCGHKIHHDPEAKSLREAVEHAIADRVSLHAASLSETFLREAFMQNADLSKADMRRSDLRGAKLDGANMDRINLRGADMEGCSIPSILTDERGYELRRIRIGRRGEYFVAGCRQFLNRADALAHWGASDYPDPERGTAFCAAINSQPLGWAEREQRE